MIKAIIFDCFGVLTGDKWKEFVATLPEEQRRPASEFNRLLDSGKLPTKDFLSKVSQLTSIPPEKIDGVINAEMHKNTELLKYIASLKTKYKIGLLSNVSSRWIHDFLTEEELGLFDDLVLSFEVGMTKHDPEIFDLTLQRLEIKASEAAFIDDNQNYVDTAKQKGIKTILYQDYVQMKKELEHILSAY